MKVPARIWLDYITSTVTEVSMASPSSSLHSSLDPWPLLGLRFRLQQKILWHNVQRNVSIDLVTAIKTWDRIVVVVVVVVVVVAVSTSTSDIQFCRQTKLTFFFLIWDWHENSFYVIFVVSWKWSLKSEQLWFQLLSLFLRRYLAPQFSTETFTWQRIIRRLQSGIDSIKINHL